MLRREFTEAPPAPGELARICGDTCLVDILGDIIGTIIEPAALETSTEALCCALDGRVFRGLIACFPVDAGGGPCSPMHGRNVY